MAGNLRWVKLNSDWLDIPAGIPIGMEESAARTLVGQRQMGEFCPEPAPGEKKAIFYLDTGQAKMSTGKGKSAKKPTTKKKGVNKKTGKTEGMTVASMAGK